MHQIFMIKLSLSAMIYVLQELMAIAMANIVLLVITLAKLVQIVDQITAICAAPLITEAYQVQAAHVSANM